MEYDYGSQMVDEPSKIKSQQLDFSKVAKKVDVRMLKSNIWDRVLTLVVFKKYL